MLPFALFASFFHMSANEVSLDLTQSHKVGANHCTNKTSHQPPSAISRRTLHTSTIMAVTQETTCTVCGKASTTRCGGCLEGVDHHGQPSPTYYCGKDCQKAHWTEHKNECKLANARKVLYRGGELLQKAYYAFREEAFDLLLCEVRKEGRHLHVYEGVWEDRRVLVRYPHHLVSDPIDKQALLSHRACTDAVAHTYQLSRKIFEGITTNKEGCLTTSSLR